jgi:hypothetical protein
MKHGISVGLNYRQSNQVIGAANLNDKFKFLINIDKKSILMILSKEPKNYNNFMKRTLIKHIYTRMYTFQNLYEKCNRKKTTK